MNKPSQYRLLTLLVFCALLLPLLSRDGMFFDGTIYASISKHMAHGEGSLWAPFYSSTINPVFYDHPPLVFGVQSLFFRVLGDGFWVERLYCLVMALLTAALIVIVWKRFAGRYKNNLDWLPVLLWLAIPLVHWAYTNNMMENTMTVFTTLAFYFLARSIENERVNYAGQAAAAAMIVCAFLSKGFTGCFPLGFYFIHWIVYRKHSFGRMMLHTLLLSMFCALIIAPFFIYKPSSFALNSYLHQQVITSLEGNREVDSHTFILGKLALELSIVIVIVLVSLMIARKKKIALTQQPFAKHAALFLLTALSASLPIVISPKQSGFYALPSLPFFALAAAMLIAPVASLLVKEKETSNKLNIILSPVFAAGIIATIAWCIMHFGEARRDSDMLHDTRVIGEHVKAKEMLLCDALKNDWTLYAYFERYNNISLGEKAKSQWWLGDTGCAAPPGYAEVMLPLKRYRLFRAAR